MIIVNFLTVAILLLVVDNQQSNTLNITLMSIKNREKQQNHTFQKQLVVCPFCSVNQQRRQTEMIINKSKLFLTLST